MLIPDELRVLQTSARRFVERELIPLEGELDETDDLPPALATGLQAKLEAAGLWALGVPEEHGGQGAPVLAQCLVTEELSRSLLGITLVGRTGTPLPVLYGASPELQARFLVPAVRGERLGAFALTEPTGGSDPVGNMTTVARPDGDDWVIDGRKCFISLGHVADHVVVFAVTNHDAGARGITAFVVERDTPGFEVVRVIPTMGPVAPAELDFRECRVPDANRIGDIGAGFVLAQQLLGRARMEIGARAVGACDRLLGMALDYVKTRAMFGKALADHEGAQWMLADCAIDLDASRWMTYAAAAEADAGGDTRLHDSIVKTFTSEALGRVADRVLQLFGGWGYSKDLPIERFYREARMWRIVEGPNEVHRWAIARQLLTKGMAPLRPA
jgi:alkylation response protein AidB-like acyl-CoA dehydrogenase